MNGANKWRSVAAVAVREQEAENRNLECSRITNQGQFTIQYLTCIKGTVTCKYNLKIAMPNSQWYP